MQTKLTSLEGTASVPDENGCSIWSGATPAARPDAGEKESCVYRREVSKQEATVGLGE